MINDNLVIITDLLTFIFEVIPLIFDSLGMFHYYYMICGNSISKCNKYYTLINILIDESRHHIYAIYS